MRIPITSCLVGAAEFYRTPTEVNTFNLLDSLEFFMTSSALKSNPKKLSDNNSAFSVALSDSDMVNIACSLMDKPARQRMVVVKQHCHRLAHKPHWLCWKALYIPKYNP